MGYRDTANRRIQGYSDTASAYGGYMVYRDTEDKCFQELSDTAGYRIQRHIIYKIKDTSIKDTQHRIFFVFLI